MFPVQSSVLAPDALAEQILPRYGLHQPVRCRLISRGVNDVYRVESTDPACYFRVSPHRWRSVADVAAELDFVDVLDRRGLAVARALRRDDGEFVTPLAAPEGVRAGALFVSAGDIEARDIDLDQCRAYGRLAASVHAAADETPAASSRLQIDDLSLIDAPLSAVRAAITGGEDLAFLEAVAERVRHRLRELPRSAPDYGLCHGDLHPGNVRFDATGRPTLFDFDFCGPGWRAYDLTVFLANAFGERRPKRWRESRWRAFLRGYAEVRPLPDAVEESVPLFLVARQIWFMGLDFSGHGGWLPQWLTPQYLAELTLPVRRWTAEYAILRD